MSARPAVRRVIVVSLLTSALSLVAAVALQLGSAARVGAPVPGGPVARPRAALTYLGATAPSSAPTPGIRCDKASEPETVQGKVPKADYDSGRADEGYTCNARMISHRFQWGGYRVERYVDAAGRECAYLDSTLLWPHDVPDQGTEGPGLYVMDMSDPANPVHTDTLRTPAMQSPHESVRLNVKRGLLVADMGYPTWNPGFVDVFSVKEDCRHPVLQSSLPVGVLGHEGGFAPDGMTYYVTSLYAHTIAAVDLTDPKVPTVLWFSAEYSPHGVSISNDGTRLYMAENAYEDPLGFSGLTILDVSQIQNRVPNPQVPLVSRLQWPELSTPQNATPFTIGGHRYLLETDEFGSGDRIGAARIIDVQDEKHPFVVSNLRLAVNVGGQTEDPGDDQPFQGYQGHYCSLPSRVDPYIVACSFIMSGLRVFDIRDPAHPREVAYFNQPLMPGEDPVYPVKAGAFAMSAPAYDQASKDIWYTDGNAGFFVVRLTKASGVTRFAGRIVTPGN
jgi:hypothetical protein